MGGKVAVVTQIAKAERFQEIVEVAARQLAEVSHRPGGSYVTTPLLYVSGSYVVIQIEPIGREYLVSDFGLGSREAEMLGGDGIFRRQAQIIAERNGVGFDHHAFFAVLASEDQITGAVASIANCSQEAVMITAMKLAEKRTRDDAEILHERLTTVFTERAVARDAELIGASNTPWHVTSLVTIERRLVAFEAVTKHPNSVVYASTKFRDLALLEKPPGRVAVVGQKKQLGTYLGVLAQAANVIEMKVGDQTLRDIAQRAA